MSSLCSACSSLRCSVASDTLLSSSAMPSANALISAVVEAMLSSSEAIMASRLATPASSSFFLSSSVSNCMLQDSFFMSSSFCSASSKTTMSSIIFNTFSKLYFFPIMAKAMKFNSGRGLPCLRSSARISCKAARRCWRSATFTCKRLEAAEGRVFLKISRASSSFKILMVSARATNSSARDFMLASCSAVFFAQFSSKFAKNFLSSSSATCVSFRSSFNVTSVTLASPRSSVFVSIAFVFAAISLAFAFMRASFSAIAVSSSDVAFSNSAVMESCSCLRMPVIWPLFGA
mmetsp:Transcript_135277/g.235222  ORF Transcript_135277/g.235222 Transcript_135277/m.235222 type:complete len:290 (+) Transcript_135277:741-1610(+)